MFNETLISILHKACKSSKEFKVFMNYIRCESEIVIFEQSSYGKWLIPAEFPPQLVLKEAKKLGIRAKYSLHIENRGDEKVEKKVYLKLFDRRPQDIWKYGG